MNTSHSPAPTAFSRRTFLHSTAAAAAFSIVPRHVLGGGAVGPNSKLNVAFIGVGSQGLRVMLSFLKHADVQAVAVCDAVKQSADYPQWGKDEFCNGVRRLLGTNSGWEWLSPNKPIRLTRTSSGMSGVAGRDPCKQIVEAYYGAGTRSGQFKGCNAYADFRELLEKEKDLDAIVVGTTDHLHAAVSIAAMKKGKHVFCQKPMTHTIYEARRMAEVARETGVATQVAVGNQASEDTRRLCEWVWSGAIGSVREVINWSSRPFWAQAIECPSEAQPVPDGLDWNLWLGPAPERPFHSVYLPFVWRGWYDFGCGALGDMGCYSFDTIFRVLKLDAPTHVEASSTDRFAETFPAASIVRLAFPERSGMRPVKVTWYDGGLLPELPDELEGTPLPKEGLLFVGDRGKILCGFTGNGPRLIPDSRMKGFQEPQKTLARSPGNDREWLDACKGNKTAPGANFQFSSAVTETILLGNVAVRLGERLMWDKAAMKASNVASADKVIKPVRRTGWEV